jgi:hypothetical protein
MLIVGCDYHLGVQQIAFMDTETGETLSAPVLLIDSSLFLASNIRLYRSGFFAFIGEPEVLGKELRLDLGYILHSW